MVYIKQIEDIINKYASYNSGLYKNQIEKLINEALSEIKEGFIAFYGDEKRQLIEDKFSKIRIIIPPISLYSSYKKMREEIGEYMNGKYSTGFYEGYFDSFTIDDNIEILDQDIKEIVYEIRKKILSYKEMADKYCELNEKIEEIIRSESYTRFVEFVKILLKKEMHYSDEILNKINEDNIDDLILGFSSYSKLFENNFDFIDLERSISFFRNLGIDIPVLNFENGDYSKKVEDIKVFKNIMLSENIKEKFLTIDIARKICNKFNLIDFNISRIANARTVQTFYNYTDSSNNFLGFLGIESANFDFLGSLEPFLIDNSSIGDIGGVIYINPYVASIHVLGATLIHEINHFLEISSYSYSKQGTYIFKCGWDEIEKDEQHQLGNHTHRSNELLNEVINEFITIDIFRKMRKNILFQDFYPNPYKNAFFLLEEFYNNYKDTIVESRQTGNLKIIYDKVGKENFEDILKLLFNFSEYVYNGFDYNKTIEKLNNGINDSDIKIYLQACEERDRILESIRKYHQGSFSMNV